jgi:hypothetical protein
MPGSSTTPGRSDLAIARPKRVAFRTRNGVGTRGLAFAAQWLAYALPYRRFAAVLADANARLGADVDRYSFTVVDLHHLLLAGLPAHFESTTPASQSGVQPGHIGDGSYRAFPQRTARADAADHAVVTSSTSMYAVVMGIWESIKPQSSLSFSNGFPFLA